MIPKPAHRLAAKAFWDSVFQNWFPGKSEGNPICHIMMETFIHFPYINQLTMRTKPTPQEEQKRILTPGGSCHVLEAFPTLVERLAFTLNLRSRRVLQQNNPWPRPSLNPTLILQKHSIHSTHVQECHSPQLCTVEAKAIWEAKVDLATRVASVTIGLGAWRGMGVEAAWDGFRMDVHPKYGVIVFCLSQTNINSTCKQEYHPHGLMGPWTHLDLSLGC